MQDFDARSEANIATLHRKVQDVAREFIAHAKAFCAPRGYVPCITSGTRTYEEQAALYAQGRTTPGDIVTNAPAGYSNHNFGLAFDVTFFRLDNGEPVWDGPIYRDVSPFGKALGLTWGGDWQSIDDEPHYELRPPWAADLDEDAMLAELRRRHDAGEDYFA